MTQGCAVKNQQPQALRLADDLEDASIASSAFKHTIASELRRLHAVNAELLEALKEIMSWEENDEMTWAPKARTAISKAEVQA
jgi:hypothetical protein